MGDVKREVWVVEHDAHPIRAEVSSDRASSWLREATWRNNGGAVVRYVPEAPAQGEAGNCVFETALRLHLGWLDSEAEHFKQNRQVGHTFRECASRLRATLAELPGDDESALPPPPKAEP